MVKTIKFEVSYSQLAVFASNLSQPFNDWTDQHVAQGFAWRPGSVSFRTLSASGQHIAVVDVVDRLGPVHPDAVRAVEVPFDVPVGGEIEIGSISETRRLELPAGAFLLRCEFLASTVEEVERVQLTFAKQDVRHFSIVRADRDVTVCGELLTTARPAPC